MAETLVQVQLSFFLKGDMEMDTVKPMNIFIVTHDWCDESDGYYYNTHKQILGIYDSMDKAIDHICRIKENRDLKDYDDVNFSKYHDPHLYLSDSIDTWDNYSVETYQLNVPKQEIEEENKHENEGT